MYLNENWELPSYYVPAIIYNIIYITPVFGKMTGTSDKLLLNQQLYPIFYPFRRLKNITT